MRARFPGFTLIELLIVVAIIAILAAIAVPNFLEAQVRAKVSRVHADERTYATALEAYYVDWNDYPPVITSILPFDTTALEEGLIPLSTPVAYLSTALFDEPFNGRTGWALYKGWDVLAQGQGPANPQAYQPIYFYFCLPPESIMGNPTIQAVIAGVFAGLPGGAGVTSREVQEMTQKRWFVVSPGPDTYFSFDRCEYPLYNLPAEDCLFEQLADIAIDQFAGIYDATNGTVSRGEIVRTSRGISLPK